MKPQTKTDTIDAQIFALDQQLQAAERERERIALALVTSAKDPDLLEELDANENLISATTKRISLFRSARIQAERVDAEEAQRARARAAVKARDDALAAIHKRGEIGKQIDAAVTALDALITQYHDASTEASRQAMSVVQLCHSTRSAHYLSKLDSMRTEVQENPRCYFRVGVNSYMLPGKQGVPHSFEMRPRYVDNPDLTMETITSRCLSKVAMRLDETLQTIEVPQ